MSTLKVIKNRIRSVGNTKKISQTMRMVSAAKYAKAEKELKAIRSFGQAATHFYELAEVNPPADPESQLLIALTGDRGLCGSIHSGIAKTIVTDMERSPKLEANTKIICIGDKTRIILCRAYPEKILWVASEVGKKPMTFIDAGLIAEKILESLADYNFHQTLIYYNKFINAASYHISTVNLYEQRAISKSSKFILYDEITEEVVNCWVEFASVAMIYWLLKEEITSEFSARMNAMENASKNASEMIRGLILTYNRTRQTTITKELIEIISGASALEKK